MLVTGLRAFVVLALAAPAVRSAFAAPPDFQADVRPILAEHCFTCHGPDAAARKAGLRLDLADEALGHRTDEGAVIVPGDAGASVLLARVMADDDDRMPPARHADALGMDEIAVLRAWIDGGASWSAHWAFVPPVRSAVPDAGDGWARNPIDRFVAARLDAEGLGPSPEADRRTLARRLALDLTGLPPTPVEIDAFLADEEPGAYDRLVDRLLASPHYGERMALRWLDLARYADTNGYSIDGGRHMWAWRDWVIGAYNANMPFDQFTIEQLAGDLLPDATTSQRIASGFNRNHMNTHEGGTIEEEYRVAYVVDRVNTTAQAWLGLTLKCAQCHDHKYDPVSQEEYYRFFAYFNTITDRGNDGNAGINSVPFIPVFAPEQEAELERLRMERAALDAELLAPDAALEAAQAAWESEERAARRPLPEFGPWSMSGPHVAESGAAAFATDFGPEAIADGGIDLAEIGSDGAPAWTVREDLVDGTVHPLAGASRAWYFARELRLEHGGTVELSFGSDDSMRAWLDGAVIVDAPVQRGAAPDQERATVEVAPGVHHLLVKIVNYAGPAGFYFAALPPGPPAHIAALVAAGPGARDAAASAAVTGYFRSLAPELAPLRERIAAVSGRIAEIEASPRTTAMVMEEMTTPRATFVLERGRYDLQGARVSPGTPDCLPAPPAGARADRLGLAQWIADPRHPLTARVAVNGIWQMVFGTGLVRTSEDFGTRGDLPSHPELLDWLAVEHVESGWDTKDLLRLIVTSATYRQSSAVPPGAAERDPDNRLLARGPRFRLQAELVRDHALAASGLLVEEVGGPSVRPYQPPGLWKEMSHFGSTPATEQVYVTDAGEKLYRRSLYTIWKRTVPPPPMVAFDAPSREVCTVRRDRTNTPLQALVLLNETGFVEAARALAERVLHEGGDTTESRVRYGFELVTGRVPAASERAVLGATLVRERARFAADPASASALLAVGDSERDPDLDPVEHAAWSVVANVLLNLSESITKG